MAELRQDVSPIPGPLDGEQLDLIVSRIDCLPTPPAATVKVVELASVSDGGGDAGGADALAQMLEVVRSDPALTARIISLANRDVGDARTVDRAAKLLGHDAVRSAVLAMSAAGAGDHDTGATGGLDLLEFQRHSVAVACAVEMLAADGQPTVPAAEAFVCGLLHDIGKLALQQCFPKSYRRVVAAAGSRGGDIAQHERNIIGVDHCAFARRLCEHWGMPATIRDASWLHAQAAGAIPAGSPNRQLIALVALADTIARREGIGFSGNEVFAPSLAEQAQCTGISDAIVQAVRRRLGEAVQRRLAHLDTGDEMIRPRASGGTLAGANVELGRINARFRRRTQALRVRAEAFERLAEFTSSLSPDATVTGALVAVARLTASGVDHVANARRPIVAYSADALGATALAGCFRGEDGTEWRRLTMNPTRLVVGIPVPAGPAHEALPALLAEAADVGDWFDPAAYEHRPLACGGEWIGGVFYPSRRREIGEGDDVLDALVAGMTLALAMVRRRADAAALGDELADASRALAAEQDATAEAKALSVVGKMAAGAAHEINNPLAVISGRAQVMAKQTEDEQARHVWRLIEDKAHQISDIAIALMEFARPAPPAPEVISTAQMLRKAADAFYSSDHPKARASRVDITIGEGLPDVLADEAQMHQVILELIVNAANAGGAAGDPVIFLAAEVDQAGDAVLMSVTDNGPGMDPQTIEGAFTPFFSAQRAGRRTGLGLPTAKRYVENNRGRMWIRSKPGRGTTVYFLLPRA